MLGKIPVDATVSDCRIVNGAPLTDDDMIGACAV